MCHSFFVLHLYCKSINIKNSEKSKSKKNTKIIRTTQPPANSTQADSEAILPNPMQMVSLGATSLRENGLSRPAKGGFHPCFCLPACYNCPVALSEFAVLFLIG